MKLLAVRMARSIWLAPQYFRNPRGLFLRPAVGMIRERYGFLRAPLDAVGQSSGPQKDEVMKFESGFFAGKSGVVEILSLALHGDGMVVETRSSTEEGDAFLLDATNFVSQEFNLPAAEELPFNKVYAGELNVQFKKAPAFLNPALEPFVAELSKALANEQTSNVAPMGFLVSADQTLSDRPPFRFEREIKTKIEDNRFYSFAPLQTEPHLRLLQRLEELS